MTCEYYDNPEYPCSGEVKLRKSMTAYCFDGVKNSPEDPNKDFYCCDEHYKDYYDYWKEQWDEYYSQIL